MLQSSPVSSAWLHGVELYCYAIRSSGTAISYTSVSATGANAEYAYTNLQQLDSLTNSNGILSLGPPLTTSVGPGVIAQLSRSTDINATGFGSYNVRGDISAYRSCDNAFYPPFDVGQSSFSYSLPITQPIASNASSRVYVYPWATYNPNGSVPAYNNHAYLQAVDYANRVGTPVWTFTGLSNNASIDCSSCNNPALTSLPTAAVSCSPVVTASYVQDGLRSNTVNVAILGSGATPQGPGTHYDIPNGYQSTYFWTAVDTCGNPLPYIFINEDFGSYDIYYPGTTWVHPSRNGSFANGDGVFFDDISQHDETNPPSLNPGRPNLGTTQIFGSLQSISTQSTTGSVFLMARPYQIHFQDHSGYIY